MLLLKLTKCNDHMEASMGFHKPIQPAQLLGLSSGPNFVRSKQVSPFKISRKRKTSDNQIADTQAGLRL